MIVKKRKPGITGTIRADVKLAEVWAYKKRG